MSRRIFLFRHGQASFGQANYDALSDQGRRQTEHLASHLLAEGIHLDHVLHGSLVRQRDSAQAYLSQAVTAGHSPRRREEPAFNEFHAEKVVRHYLPRLTLERPELGRLLQEENGFRRHFEKIFEAVIRSWQADEHPHPRLENWTSFRDRVQRGFAELTAALGENEQAGIFTSGGVISVLMQPLMEEDDGLMARLNHRIANASISVVTLDADRPRLERFNDYDHLREPELISFR